MTYGRIGLEIEIEILWWIKAKFKTWDWFFFWLVKL